MLGRRYGSFTGGIDLPDEKQATGAAKIAPAPFLPRLRVPLAAPARPAAHMLVAPGELVQAGQLIARGDAASPDVYAPLSGKVTGLVEAYVAGSEGLSPVPALELTDLSLPEPPKAPSPRTDWRGIAITELLQLLWGGGLTTYRADHEPLGSYIARARRVRELTLIANAVEHAPYVASRHRLLCEHGQDAVRGLAMLAKAMGAKRVILAVDGRRIGSYGHLVNLADMLGVRRVALAPKYPIGADSILTRVLTRRQVSPGGEPLDVGVAMVEVACCLGAYRWVTAGEPMTHTLVTLAGERLGFDANVWMPLGAVCGDLIPGPKWPVIHGSPMAGLRCRPDAVVSAATDALLALDEPPARNPGTCIRCGWCTDNCPARLNVALLNDAFELGMVDRAARRQVAACVDCGLCSYLCPAYLPLAQRISQLKALCRLAKEST